MVSVPVQPGDIMNTVKQLPRLPSEAGLIPVKLKRKKQYKEADKRMKGMIRPEKIFQALQYLREQGHPSYNFYDSKEDYLARCKELNRRGDRLLMGEEDWDEVEDREVEVFRPAEVLDEVAGQDATSFSFSFSQTKKQTTSTEEDSDDLEKELEREEADIESDPVRRQHFNYAENSVIVNGHPEIFLNDDGEQVADVNFAPAEGKKPENFLDQKDWDINSWPGLHPDGKFGLDHKRKVALSSQKYFQQRILNKDDRFAKTPGYVFAAMSHVEAARLRSNVNLSGFKGKRTTDEDGQASYTLKDPFTVLAGIPGTPKYWQKVKLEMIAKLENLGPFHWFFTLSCGDLR